MADTSQPSQAEVARKMLGAFKRAVRESGPIFADLVNRISGPIIDENGTVITNSSRYWCINLFEATNVGGMKGTRKKRFICLDTQTLKVVSCCGEIADGYDYKPADRELEYLFQIPGNFKQAMQTLRSANKLKQVNVESRRKTANRLLDEYNKYK